MLTYPKFIIESDIELGDCLIVSNCTYHKELAKDFEKVKGGGWWTLDKKNKSIIFYGESHEFGKASIDNIAQCLRNNKIVFFQFKEVIAKGNYKFLYRNDLGEIINL